jgi:hypothetical protein
MVVEAASKETPSMCPHVHCDEGGSPLDSWACQSYYRGPRRRADEETIPFGRRVSRGFGE